MSGLIRPIRDRRRSCRSSVCGRDDGRDVVVDGMLRRRAVKSDHYTSELVLPDSLHAVWRHLSFYDSQWQFSAPNFAPVGADSG